MQRTVRNGLAIAGMAGGMWLLGHAVANADTGTQSAASNADTSVTQTDSSHGGSNFNGSLNTSEAKNVQVTEVSTTVKGGNGGTNTAEINTGAQFAAVGGGGSVTLNTGDVNVSQQANGGDVSGSGNVAVASGGGSQTAISNASTTVDQTSTGNEHHDSHGPKDSLGPEGMGGPGGNFNLSGNFSEAKNIDITRVDTTVKGGNGGDNYADINTGLQGAFIGCEHHGDMRDFMKKDDHGCTINITTGDVNLSQEANGGSVSNSGNVGINAPVPGQVAPCTCPQQQEKKKAAAAAPMGVVPAKSVAVLSAAQPTAVLATTGAEYGAPLALGLLALGAGAGLTIAGRRRKSAAL